MCAKMRQSKSTYTGVFVLLVQNARFFFFFNFSKSFIKWNFLPCCGPPNSLSFDSSVSSVSKNQYLFKRSNITRDVFYSNRVLYCKSVTLALHSCSVNDNPCISRETCKGTNHARLVFRYYIPLQAQLVEKR